MTYTYIQTLAKTSRIDIRILKNFFFFFVASFVIMSASRLYMHYAHSSAVKSPSLE